MIEEKKGYEIEARHSTNRDMVLILLAFAPQPSITHIARALGKHRSNISERIPELFAAGAITRDENGRYALTDIGYAEAAKERIERHLEALQKRFDDTIDLLLKEIDDTDPLLEKYEEFRRKQ